MKSNVLRLERERMRVDAEKLAAARLAWSCPWGEVALCMDCEHAYNMREPACPNCGSEAMHKPANWTEKGEEE